jgi:hypothetical protein
MKLTGFESSKINSEMVNHPSHYNLSNRKECIDEMIDIYGLKDVAKWCEITAYKYKYRAGHKDSPTQDVQKAIWYTIKARELKSERRWEKFSKIADRYLPIFIKGIFAWLMLFCMLHAILFSDQCSMAVSIVFLALACIAESILKENEDN